MSVFEKSKKALRKELLENPEKHKKALEKMREDSKNTNHVTNGILLRADIHTLFDLGLIGINQKYEVVVASSLQEADYDGYYGKIIRLPPK